MFYDVGIYFVFWGPISCLSTLINYLIFFFYIFIYIYIYISLPEQPPYSRRKRGKTVRGSPTGVN